LGTVELPLPEKKVSTERWQFSVEFAVIVHLEDIMEYPVVMGAGE
jgi:hypothetical protein